MERVGLLQRDKKCWKRPRSGKKVSGCGGQLTGGSGLYCAAASLEGNRGISATTPQPPPNPDCHLPTCSLRLPHLSLSSPVPILAALFAPARKLRGLILRAHLPNGSSNRLSPSQDSFRKISAPDSQGPKLLRSHLSRNLIHC